MTAEQSVFKRMNAWRLRIFPERQLFLRSEGRVRFLTISSPVQIGLTVSVTAAALWGLVTTVHFLTRDLVLEAKEQKIVQINDDYRALSTDFSKLEAELERRTQRLEQRQAYLESLTKPVPEVTEDTLSDEPVLVSSSQMDGSDPDSSADFEGDTGDGTPASSADNAADSAADSDAASSSGQISDASALDDMGSGFFFADLFGAEEDTVGPDLSAAERRSRLLDRLQALELRQRRVAETALQPLTTEIARLDKALEPLKLSTERVATAKLNAASAAGGPYIPAQEFGPVFKQDDQALYEQLADSALTLNVMRDSLATLPLGRPAKDYYISSLFGRRRDPIRKAVWANHPGVDLAGWPGTAILAPAAGVVVAAQWNGAYGRMVEIDHGNGYRSRFGHMRKLHVSKDDIVELGQKLGEMGKTGRATDTHLHYEIWFEGKLQDPLPYLKAKADVFKVDETSYWGQ